MSIFDDIGNAFKSAASTIVDGVKQAVNGLQDLFGGHVETGLRDIAMGVASGLGLVPSQLAPLVDQYQNAIGETMQWAQRRSQQINAKVCYSEYLAEVKANFGRHNLQWTSTADQKIREGANSMSWINMGC